jgi:hypothetical protein
LVGEEGSTITLGDEIVIQGERNLADCQVPLDHGPFSWQGMARPTITPGGDRITIAAPAELLDPSAPGFDPTGFFALMSTITWAANALETGICSEHEEAPTSTSRRPAHPLLTMEEIELAVAALRRDRESLGLVLLALAVFSLALGLRRSVR